MPIYYDKAKKRYRFTLARRVNGKHVRASKLLPASWTQRQCELFDQAETGRIYAELTDVSSARLTTAGAIQLYLDHRVPDLRNGLKAAKDITYLLPTIERFPSLDQLPDLAAAYVKENATRLSKATLHNRLAYLRAAANYARKHHGYGRKGPNHAADMMVPTPSGNERQEYLQIAELRKLWKEMADPECVALFKLVFYLGLRWRAELLSREPKHVVKNGRDTWLEIGRTKNGAPVMKPVHKDAVSALKFIPFNKPESHYRRAWNDARAAIGRPELRPHDLRHSLASEVLSRAGGTLDDVRAALHHQSVQAAKRYAHLYPERMKQILMSTGSVVQKITHRSKNRQPKTAK